MPSELMASRQEWKALTVTCGPSSRQCSSRDPEEQVGSVKYVCGGALNPESTCEGLYGEGWVLRE